MGYAAKIGTRGNILVDHCTEDEKDLKVSRMQNLHTRNIINSLENKSVCCLKDTWLITDSPRRRFLDCLFGNNEEQQRSAQKETGKI